ncbi:hypothetical protein OSTOST_22423 [Ostertagia ostertagi]
MFTKMQKYYGMPDNRHQSCLRKRMLHKEPNPLCDGREASAGYCRAGGVCASGFTCTGNNVCCRCAYGTSIGPCVNQQCPDNFQCNINNECCPYQMGK